VYPPDHSAPHLLQAQEPLVVVALTRAVAVAKAAAAVTAVTGTAAGPAGLH